MYVNLVSQKANFERWGRLYRESKQALVFDDVNGELVVLSKRDGQMAVYEYVSTESHPPFPLADDVEVSK